jgi:hypothetical protein
MLTDSNLLRDGVESAEDDVLPGEHRFFSTGDAESFHRLAQRFLGLAVGPIASLPAAQAVKAADAAEPVDTAPDASAIPVPVPYSADSIPVPSTAAAQ